MDCTTTFANEIIEFNMKEVAKIINAGLKFIGENEVKIAFNGSLIINNPEFIDLMKKYINPDYKCTFELITKPPVYGALEIAKKLI